MKKMIKLILCALVAAALLLPCAAAESPSDDVSGFNPFDPEGSAGVAGGELSPVAPAATPQAEGTPFVQDSATSMADPFGSNAGNAGGTVSAVPTPLPAINSGNNPFDSAAPAIPVPAQQVSKTMFVTASTVKITNRAESKARRLVTVSFGEQLAMTALQGDWAQVQTSKGLKGYCPISALSETDPNTMNKQMYAQMNSVVIHTTPSTKSGRVRILKKGDTVTMTAITSDGQWARVTDGSKFGFVPTMYLDDAPSAEGTPVWCNMGATELMVNPDAWVQVGTLSFGQPVHLVGYVANNTIAKVRNEKGAVAYCDINALTTADPATLSTPVYAQASGRVMCSDTGSSPNYYNINKNVRMTLLGVDPSGNWALVKQGKRKVYIPFVFLGNERPNRNFKVVVSNQDAPLYQSAKSGAAILGTLPMGTRLNLMGGEHNLMKVSTISDGTVQAVVGYIDMRFVYSETQVNTAVVNDNSDIASGFFQ